MVDTKDIKHLFDSSFRYDNFVSECNEYGLAVKLECRCMTYGNTAELWDRLRPWSQKEVEVLTKREYKLLSRYHSETCNLKGCEI